MEIRLVHHIRRGYTLIEVLAASAVIAVGMTAMVSLVGSLTLQEELAWRTAITRNYQENMVRLWQLGMSPSGSSDPTNLAAVMPTQTNSVLLNEAINGNPYLIEIGTADPEGLGKLQAAAISASVNVSSDPKIEVQGSSFTLTAYRPSLPTSLRTD
jgi:prepilin-type N-terminal cleavage/methylation domain-containing protein